jgi:protein-S-isoprenylcysteine O-methyltransferase Ste14
MNDGRPMRSPGVRFPPPLLYLGGLALGWALGWLGPVFPLAINNVAALHAVGWLLLVAGVMLSIWGAATFRAANTAIVPMRSASSIVTTGPYKFTRNPMYVGMTIAYCGISFLLNSLWPLLFLPVVLFLLVHFVIRREEAYLSQAFPDEYGAYRMRVRRWL